MSERAKDEELIRAFLASRDQACPVCDYELRGGGRVCPECGTEFELLLVECGAHVWVDPNSSFAPPVLTAVQATRREVRMRNIAGVVWVGAFGLMLLREWGFSGLALLVAIGCFAMASRRDAIQRRYERMREEARYARSTRSAWIVFVGSVILLLGIAAMGGD